MVAMIEGPDLLIVLAIALVLFGGKKLPELARSLGAAKKEFEAGQHDGPASTPTAPDAPEKQLPASDA